MTNYRLLLRAALLLMLSATSGYARQSQEVAPADPDRSYIVSGRVFTPTNPLSGAYYGPQVVTTADTVWLFVMGGQIGNGGPTADKCFGDKIIVFKLPLTQAGITSTITTNTLKQRISPCDNSDDPNDPIRYHYSTDGIVFDNVHKTYRMTSERWEASTDAVKLRLFEGWYRSTGAGWNIKWYDFMDVVKGSGPPRITAFLLHPDAHRANRNPANSYFRGYMKMGSAGMAEVRVEFPPLSSCTTPGRRCANIEFRTRANTWRPVVRQTLDFIPDSMPEDFRISQLTTINGSLRLWGSVLSPGTDGSFCGRCWNASGVQQPSGFAYRDVHVGPDWSLGELKTITSAVRCMPAWHRTSRISLALVRLPSNGKLYMFSSGNDDDLCQTLDHPFHGMDVIWSQLQ